MIRFKTICNLIWMTFIFMVADTTELNESRDDDYYIDIENFEDVTVNNHEFDLLIFTQRWPITACMEWRSHNPNRNECDMPPTAKQWSIHGIWPTKFGTIGPAFCNTSAEFDITKLKPLMDNLEKHWPNLEKGKTEDSLWEHEWLKHGTCASVLPPFDSELKYFKKGLDWRSAYTIGPTLEAANLHYGGRIELVRVHEVIRAKYNVNPSIHCFHDRNTNDMYLDEIRLCFSKTLGMTDCDGVATQGEPSLGVYNVGFGQMVTNCYRPNEPYIVYPSEAIFSERPKPWLSKDFMYYIGEIHKLIRFIFF